MPSDLTRRGVLGAAATAAAVALAAPTKAAADSEAACAGGASVLATAPAGGRIDLHTHHVPPVWRQALSQAGITTVSGYPIPQWTPDAHLTMMDTFGIQTAVLSLPDPGVSFLSGEPAATLARQVNEYTASLIKQHPTRFGGFAVLPLPDVQASLRELAYALDVLKLDGVAILSSYAGTNVALPQFEALWLELNRRKAYTLLHPATLADNDKPGYALPDASVEFTFDTSRFCAVALNTGLTTTYPDLRVQLANAGGAMPFLLFRISVIQNGPGNSLPVKGADAVNALLPAAQIKPFLFDTALSASPAQMDAVLEIAAVDRIVFGSDWPFTDAFLTTPGDPQPPLSTTFSAQERHVIERSNAHANLPRVAAALGNAPAAKTVDVKLVKATLVKTKTRRRQLRMQLAFGETAQIRATLSRRGKTLASQLFAPAAKGARTMRFELPDELQAGSARLVVQATDVFGNSATIKKTIQLPGEKP